MEPRVIVGLARWGDDVGSRSAAQLVAGLNRLGRQARILVTEGPFGDGPSLPANPVAAGEVPVDRIPARPDDAWGVRWEALERYLEEQAPCHVLLGDLGGYHAVAPRLSDRVMLIGQVQGDQPGEFDRVARYGLHWNAIVAATPALHLTLIRRFAHLAGRVADLPPAVAIPGARPPRPDGPLRVLARIGPSSLAQALAIARALDARGVAFHLSLVGGGPAVPDLPDQAASLRERGRIGWLDSFDGVARLDAWRDHHVFLVPGTEPGSLIDTLEAMGSGCVPVVPRYAVASTPVRHGENGWTARPGDIDAFAAQIQALDQDRVRLAVMADRAAATIVAGGHDLGTHLTAFQTLLDRVQRQRLAGHFRRYRGAVAAVVGESFGADQPGPTRSDLQYVSENPPWPNPRPQSRNARARGSTAAHTHARLADHKVIVAIPGGQISGVDVFASHLIRRLRARGLEARIVGARVLDHPLGMPIPDDIPVDQLPVYHRMPWSLRWRQMAEYLEAQAPCIYVPNYDYEQSCISPWLSDRVKIAGICHSDDPLHYEQILRIGRYCNAVVAVSAAIEAHLGELDPSLVPRLERIPYGIPLPDGPPSRPQPDGMLRILYAGRLIQHQKRAGDVVAIARELDRRGVPFELAVVGDGPLRPEMEQQGRDLILRRQLWFTGKLPNHDLLNLAARYDALLLPSAFEGLSVGLLEAMSRGLVPVVGAIRSGTPEVVKPDRTGLVAGVGDIAGFADQLARLHAEPELRSRLASQAAHRVLQGGYGLDDMAGRYLALFERIVDEPFVRPAGQLDPPAHLRPQTWMHVRAQQAVRLLGRRILRAVTARRDTR